MELFHHNMIPDGEDGQHIPSRECQCHPKVIEKEGVPYLLHLSRDHREFVYAVEMMLGFRCNEHMHYCDRDAAVHTHTKLPDRYYEYDHPRQ